MILLYNVTLLDPPSQGGRKIDPPLEGRIIKYKKGPFGPFDSLIEIRSCACCCRELSFSNYQFDVFNF
jgi:hypothetical protein